MAKILWNKQGDPLMAYGKTYFATTTGAPEEVQPVKLVEELDIIGRTGVLNTGLKYIRNFTLGQGIFPVRVTGYNDKGDEILEVINDPKITSFPELHNSRQLAGST